VAFRDFMQRSLSDVRSFRVQQLRGLQALRRREPECCLALSEVYYFIGLTPALIIRISQLVAHSSSHDDW